MESNQAHHCFEISFPMQDPSKLAIEFRLAHALRLQHPHL